MRGKLGSSRRFPDSLPFAQAHCVRNVIEPLVILAAAADWRTTLRLKFDPFTDLGLRAPSCNASGGVQTMAALHDRFYVSCDDCLARNRFAITHTYTHTAFACCPLRGLSAATVIVT